MNATRSKHPPPYQTHFNYRTLQDNGPVIYCTFHVHVTYSLESSSRQSLRARQSDSYGFWRWKKTHTSGRLFKLIVKKYYWILFRERAYGRVSFWQNQLQKVAPKITKKSTFFKKHAGSLQQVLIWRALTCQSSVEQFPESSRQTR